MIWSYKTYHTISFMCIRYYTLDKRLDDQDKQQSKYNFCTSADNFQFVATWVFGHDLWQQYGDCDWFYWHTKNLCEIWIHNVVYLSIVSSKIL